MGRTPSTPGGRPHRWCAPISEQEKDRLDQMRGALDPASFARLLLMNEWKRRANGDQKLPKKGVW